ncbi:MAG: DUF1428 domain-containing protein [Rhodospirillales bacterium]|nr:DUF1428 domain-containing protein [Rhodospirillales bacterium]
MKKTKYVEGFVLAVPTRNKAKYLKMAKIGAKMFAELGALRLVETWADDVPKGKWTDFYRSVKAKKSESIVFAWVEWPSRQVRNAAMKKMMADPQHKDMFKDMPFDGKRMIFGGFSMLLDA